MTALSLPPNVQGPSCGSLELQIDEISWRTKTICSSKSIVAFIRFWGESPDTAARLTIFENHPKRRIQQVRYQIKTNAGLFRSYLSNAEPIRIELLSLRTNELIGRCSVRFPLKMVDFREEEEETTCSTASPIFGPNNNRIGDLIVNFRLKLDKTTMVEAEPPPPTRVRRETFTRRDLDHEVNELSELLLNNVPPMTTIHSSRGGESSFEELDEGKQRRIMSFLLGQRVSPAEEDRLLQEICRISPASSLVEALNRVKGQMKAPKQPEVAEFGAIWKNIDTLKIAVQDFAVTEDGVREIREKLAQNSISQFNVVVECQMNPNLISAKSSTLYFFSPALIDGYIPSKIQINKKFVKQLRAQIDEKAHERAILVLIVWIRDTSSKISYILGASKVSLTKLLKGSTTGCTSKTQVKMVGGTSSAGLLSIRLDLACSKLNSTLGLNESTSDVSKQSQEVNGDQKEQKSEPLAKQEAIKSTQTPSSPRNDASDKPRVAQGDEKPSAGKEPEVMMALLYFGGVKTVEGGPPSQLSLSYYDAFLSEYTRTGLCHNGVFNYLKVFPIVCDDKFLAVAKHNHILVETHQGHSLVATIRLPLHQFYIAFRDDEIKAHLTRSRLPVISIDGWSNLQSVRHADAVFGQLQVLLAVGTEMQIETLKATRGLTTNLELPVAAVDPPPEQESPPAVPPQSTNAGTQTANPQESNFTQTTPLKNDAQMQTSRSSGPTSLDLTAFIENLAQKLPNGQQKPPSTSSAPPQLKKTSDLLDLLQRALHERPTAQNLPGTLDGFLKPEPPPPPKPADRFRICVSIEAAKDLPRVHLNKKHACRSKGKAAGKAPANLDVEPSAYVTFEATDGPATAAIKSHEGVVYTTHVVERSCTPVWEKRFEVAVAADQLWSDQKHFVLKVWRKPMSNERRASLEPTPLQDAVVGFTAVNLKVFLSGSRTIGGWFNIVDFSGRCNGQIKVTITLFDDLRGIISPPTPPTIPSLEPRLPLGPIHLPGASSSAGVSELPDDEGTPLSRALKRKFTELEEISQRLRARLFDITTDAEEMDDDEFERDLNTVVEEDDVGAAGTDNFEWLGANKDMFKGMEEPGCSEPSSDGALLNLDSLLKTHDIDSLINPNIFKNLIDPEFASSSDNSSPMVRGSGTTASDVQELSSLIKDASISDNDEEEGLEHNLDKI